MEHAIRIEHVSKSFYNTVALDDVTFTIRQGEIFGLLGPNGAGKTTLMRILIGILAADSGKVHVTPNDTRPLKQRIGYLPEERGLYQKMKVKHLLHYFGAIKGLDRKTIKTVIPEGLEQVGLAGQENKIIEELSKGNQQRIQLLLALLHKPSLLILDEPFTGLDPIGVDQMKKILSNECQRGATVIISTHHMEDAEQLCKSIALIHRGKVIRSGDLGDIKKSEGRDELIIQYEGDSTGIHSVQEVTVLSDQEKHMRLRIQNGHPIPELIRRISSRMDVYSINHAVPTLHNIFVELVGRETNKQ